MVKSGGSAVKPSPANDAERLKLADGEALEDVKILAERGGEFVEAELVKVEELKKPGF
jgi:hypothetical protein